MTVGVEIFDALDARDGFVDGHGADGHGRVADDGFADFVNVAAGGEIHDGVGAVVDGGVQLFELFVDVGSDGRIADVGVDLAERGDADGHGLEFGMVDVGGDDHAAASDFVADQLGRDLFAVGDVLHFLGDDALAGVVHLREVAVFVLAVFGFALGEPLGARFENFVKPLPFASFVPLPADISCTILRGVCHCPNYAPHSG